MTFKTRLGCNLDAHGTDEVDGQMSSRITNGVDTNGLRAAHPADGDRSRGVIGLL